MSHKTQPKAIEIDINDVRATEVSAPKISRRADDEKEYFDHKENMQHAELGWLGKIWGGRSEKPGNVGAVVLVFLVLIIIYMAVFKHDVTNFKDIMTGFSSIITLILGYLFGSSDRS